MFADEKICGLFVLLIPKCATVCCSGANSASTAGDSLIWTLPCSIMADSTDWGAAWTAAMRMKPVSSKPLNRMAITGSSSLPPYLFSGPWVCISISPGKTQTPLVLDYNTP